MSLLSRNELRVRVAPDRCEIGLWTKGLFDARCEARASAVGEGRRAMESALVEIITAGKTLPKRARIELSDDSVFYALLEAHMPLEQARDDAEHFFTDTLGLSDLDVEVALAPGGRHWIAVAVQVSALDAWLEALDERNIQVLSIRPALLEDLRSVSRLIDSWTQVLAIVREQGVMVLQLDEGRLVGLDWERIDWRDPALVFERLGGWRTPAGEPAAILPSTREQHRLLDLPGREAGWEMLASLESLQEVTP
ncbi:MAG: hypothetical protein RL375_2588 [Pseudomonadota bacterium]